MNQNNKWRPNQNFFSNLAVVLLGILFYLGLSHLDLVRGTLGGFARIVSPFIGGFVMAYLLDGPVRFFEKKLRIRRSLAIVLTYVLAIVLVAVLLSFVIPQLVQSVMALVDNAGGYLNGLNAFVQDLSKQFKLDEELLDTMMLSYKDLVQQAANLLKSVLPQLLNYSVAVGSGVISALTALIASIYMLVGKDKLLAQLRKVVYAFLPLPRAQRVLGVCSHANHIFTGFINGKIIDSAIIGVICFVCTSLFGIQFALLISVVVGVTNIIPFFGPFIGAVPCIMILLMVNPIQALEFGIFVIVLQQFDGNILGPKILGDSTGLSAIWVLVAIIVGGGLFGFVGMVVGVPTFAVLYSLTSDFLAARLKAKNINAAGEQLPAEGPPQEATQKKSKG
ncbi:AI-2E family transporter [Allofournierella sp.]|uniref:AI-2E family transporter n=1 Tax=Allofournierella sp. TaxID=1940256 RepID=UPI003AB36DCE